MIWPLLSLIRDDGKKSVPETISGLIAEGSPDSLIVFNRRGDILFGNSAATKLFACSKDELLGQEVEKLLPGLFGIAAKRIAKNDSFSSLPAEIPGFRKNGSQFAAEVTLSTIESPMGSAVVASVRDVSKGQIAQSHLRENERLFRLIVESVEDYAIYASDTQGYVVSWNSGTERIKQYRAHEIIGEHFARFYTEEDRASDKPARDLAIAAEHGRYVEEGWRVRKDGVPFWAGVVISAMVDPQAKLLGFAHVTRDLTERRRAEELLQQSEEKFSKAFFSSPLAASISTFRDGLYLEVNEAFLRLIGRKRDDVVGYTSTELGVWANLGDRPQLIEQFQGAERVEGVTTIFHNLSGEELKVKISAEIIHLDGIACLLAITQDMTEAYRLDLQSRQLQKLEAIGRLAGGIAHDFNNVLNVILGYCHLLLDPRLTAEESRSQISRIVKAATRATDLTRQLLAFGRKQFLQTKVIDLNKVIQDTADLIERLIGEDIEVSMSLSETLAPINADPTQIVQIILNLAANARDAMPSGGKLTIRTANIGIHGGYQESQVRMPGGDYAQLVVADTGMGMDDATKARIFEPFFTTKQLGQGTGLGLATVYGIVKQSGGSIWVDSEPDQGTTFRIYFPCSRGAVRKENVLPTCTPELRGDETILVLEDSDDLREVAVSFLESAGFQVLQSHDPEQGLELARVHRGQIHLLLTDVVLPKMSGRIVAERIRDSRPDIRVLFVSGYTDDVIVRHGVLNQDVNFLQKPYTYATLISKIRSVLDLPSEQNHSATSASD